MDSSVSIISANPRRTSTPTSNRFRRRVIEREESTTSFDRIRQMWQRFSGRSVSSVSSGVGSSIRSRESQEEPVQNNQSNGLRKFFMKNRRCISDLNRQRPTSTTSTTRLIQHPIPFITIQPPSPPRRRSSNLFLYPNGMNGPTIQRSTSQPADSTNNLRSSQPKLRHSNSDMLRPPSITVRRIQRHNASSDLNLQNLFIDSSILFANPNQSLVTPLVPQSSTSCV